VKDEPIRRLPMLLSLAVVVLRPLAKVPLRWDFLRRVGFWVIISITYPIESLRSLTIGCVGLVFW
jgi:hypothetical protein